MKIPPPKKSVTNGNALPSASLKNPAPVEQKPAISEPEASSKPLKKLAPPKKMTPEEHNAKSYRNHVAITGDDYLAGIMKKLPGRRVVASDDTDIPAGQIRRRAGDIIQHGGSEWIIDRVGKCSAIAVSLVNKSKEMSISTCCDKQDVIRRETNFQSAKSAPVGTTNAEDKKQQTENTDMIETLVSKAIASGKDDNKILAMCLSNYPDVPAMDAMKLIAKVRKNPAKFAAAASAPVPRGKGPKTPPPAKAKVAKAPKGDTIDRVAFCLDLAKAGNSEAKITQAYTKAFGAPSAHFVYIIGREFRRVNKASAKPAKAASKVAPAPKAKAKVAPAPAPKKAAKPAPAPKAVSPPPPKAAAPVPGAEGVPAQGEEVPAE